MILIVWWGRMTSECRERMFKTYKTPFLPPKLTKSHPKTFKSKQIGTFSTWIELPRNLMIEISRVHRFINWTKILKRISNFSRTRIDKLRSSRVSFSPAVRLRRGPRTLLTITLLQWQRYKLVHIDSRNIVIPKKRKPNSTTTGWRIQIFRSKRT